MDLSNKNIIHIKNENIEYLQFRRLLEYKEIIHCYTLSNKNINFKMVQEENGMEKDLIKIMK